MSKRQNRTASRVNRTNSQFIDVKNNAAANEYMEQVLGKPLDKTSIDYYKKNGFFKSKNVLITGCTGGVGSVLVRALIELEANVYGIYRNSDRKFAGMKNNASLKTYQIDLKQPSKITSEFQKIMEDMKGKIDIILLCHGTFYCSDLAETSFKSYDEAMNVDLRSFVHILSLATPFLKLSKGCVVMCSSLESYIPAKNSLLGSITKSMINSLIENSALELASFGIRVNGVAPGIIYTSHRVNEDFPESFNQKFMQDEGKNNILNNEVVFPQDVAETILFLASDDAGFMTGEIIKVDNGYSLNHDLNFSEGMAE